MKKIRAHRSPLFYVGDKYKIYPEISKNFPTNINKFIEPFTGGGSVFLNVIAKKYLLNDIDPNVINIHNFLIGFSKNQQIFFDEILKRIRKYNLSHSYITDVVPKTLKNKWVKTYYAKYNKEGFNKLKNDFNRSKKKDILNLYLLLIYGFNRMLRFNSKGEFNLPVGNVDFNSNVYAAILNYFALIKNRNIKIFNLDFVDFLKKVNFEKNDFVYLDPPYLITFSEYNKLWDEKTELRFIKYLDYLNDLNIKFAVSNVTHYKGKINKTFLNWSNKYNIKNIKSNYISYHDNTIKSFSEVLVFNYEINNQSLFDNYNSIEKKRGLEKVLV